MSNGRFGIHGGQYIPETLMNAVIELEKAYDHYKEDPAFVKEYNDLFCNENIIESFDNITLINYVL